MIIVIECYSIYIYTVYACRFVFPISYSNVYSMYQFQYRNLTKQKANKCIILVISSSFGNTIKLLRLLVPFPLFLLSRSLLLLLGFLGLLPGRGTLLSPGAPQTSSFFIPSAD